MAHEWSYVGLPLVSDTFSFSVSDGSTRFAVTVRFSSAEYDPSAWASLCAQIRDALSDYGLEISPVVGETTQPVQLTEFPY